MADWLVAINSIFQLNPQIRVFCSLVGHRRGFGRQKCCFKRETDKNRTKTTRNVRRTKHSEYI